MDIRTFPFLLPFGEGYKGLITIAGKDYSCDIRKSQDFSNRYEIRFSSDIRKIVSPKTIKNELQSSESLDDLCTRLREFVEKLSEKVISKNKIYSTFSSGKNSIKSSNSSGIFFKRIIREVDELGWDNIFDISMDCSRVKLQFRNKLGSFEQNHRLSIHLDSEHYPMLPPEVETPDLPLPFEFIWNEHVIYQDNEMEDEEINEEEKLKKRIEKKEKFLFGKTGKKDSNLSSLRDILEQYHKELEKYHFFWLTLNDLDSHCHILEPEIPTPSHTFRRIKIGRNCSFSFDLNPLQLHNIPEIQFLGADSIVNMYRKNVKKNTSKWVRPRLNTERGTEKMVDEEEELEGEGETGETESNFLRKNLQALLGTDLTKKKEKKKTEEEEEDMEMCGICYSYRLESHIPEFVCNNVKCLKPFHLVCLRSWLSAIPSKKKSEADKFLTGECPYCQIQIKIKKN